MTNVRVMTYEEDDDGIKKLVVDEDATKRRKRRKSLSKKEIMGMLAEADKIEVSDPCVTKFFRLRAKAIVAIAKVFGKRRAEIASLEVDDLEIIGEYLHVYFTLRKKRKRGLFQYIEFLKKKIGEGEMSREEFDNKTQLELETEWKAWQETDEGVRVREVESEKKVKLDSPYAQIIIEYWEYVKKNYPDSVYLFPAGWMVYGEYKICDEAHLDPQSLLRIVKDLNPKSWMHLFREMKGGDIAKKHGRTLDSIYRVQEALDLERPETAHAYIKRAFTDEME